MMQRILTLLCLCAVLLGACGTTTGTAVQEPPTPTPLPPDPQLERPTYTAASGEIARLLEITARITPVDLVRLAFRRDGRVNTVAVKRDDTVKAGDVLAELQQDDALDDLRNAQDGVTQSQRDLVTAKQAQAKDIADKELGLQKALDDLGLLLPGGDKDQLKAAQQALADAQRELVTTRDDKSWTKTSAESGLVDRADALKKSQTAYSEAFNNWEWVKKYGTDPNNPTKLDENGRLVPNKLTDKQKREFEQALADAETALRAAERTIEDGERTLDKARDDEVVSIQKAEEKVAKAQKDVDTLIGGKGSPEIVDARRAIEQAKLALAESKTKTFNTEVKAVENAKRALDKAKRKVDDGRIIAPRDGQVLSVAAEPGAQATAFEPAIEVADPSKLEFAANLGADQMRQLSEGQPVEIRLLTRPDLVLPGVIRQMPAPYGTGGSGAVRDVDQTTRITVLDALGQDLVPGRTVAKIQVVLEKKDKVVWLPPEAIRSFEGRSFVIVREGDAERRVTIRTGIATAERVEIVSGVKAGDVIVGQ